MNDRTSARSARIAIVAAAMRDRIATLLAQDGFEVVVLAAKASQMPAPTRVDLIVHANASAAAARGKDLKQLRRKHPDARIVVVIDKSTDLDVRKVVEEGASGVVSAGDVDEALAPSVRAVLVGQLCVPDRLMQSLHRPTLTVREKQILSLVVLGLSNGEIARRLYLAESTIKSHLSSAYAKLGVRSRTAATERILDRSLGLGTGILAITEPEPAE